MCGFMLGFASKATHTTRIALQKHNKPGRPGLLLNQDKSLLVGLLFLEVDHRGEGGGRHPGEGER